jgi:hypothetical protein
MELRGEMPRFNVIAKTAEGRRAALVGPSRWFGGLGVARCLSVAQGVLFDRLTCRRKSSQRVLDRVKPKGASSAPNKIDCSTFSRNDR